MVSASALPYTSLSLSRFQILAVHGEAEKERAEAKRKIAKLEDTLRYSEKSQTQVLLVAGIQGVSQTEQC